MFGFDLRDNDDIINDVERLHNLCQDYKEIRDKLKTLMILTNIEDMIKCECRDYKNEMSFQERMKCPKCKGIGYILKYKEKDDKNENKEC